MASTMSNYVKFIRGTPTAFEKLATKDPDTLYFIKETSATYGSLYIGDTLISDGSLTEAKSINDLTDVAIDSSTLLDRNVLGYNWTNQEWENIPLGEISIGEMKGATAEENGQSGLVPVPLAGDQGKFLRGDAQWISVDDMIESATQGLKARVSTLETTVQTQGNSISLLQTNVTNLDTSLSTFQNVYKTEIGTFSDMKISEDNTDKTIVGEINSINRRLTWSNY